ncbi:hypothetical protein E6Q11_04405 [Candidatus Dojkabacteria bacterium]|uniref:Alpha/beta fold hydrolase n=1 Tax=Candidatus Dojkabacteria bacterium TaxID=2099670 RepID=A0A5C7J4S8_9BACT|nr:MAG: hypothetical protein E6Q11_04405 [Candidatus Dojkabacteria bacterium]
MFYTEKMLKLIVPKLKEKKAKKRRLLIFIFIALFILLALILGPTIYKIVEVKIYQHQIAAFYSPSADLKNKKPGDVLKLEEIKTPVVGGKAYRLLYVSQLPDDTLVPVSGVIYVSDKDIKNKNIVAWAHGTVGLGASCAPSKSLAPTAILQPWITMMMEKGWIVVATDYSGLGISGEKQYLVGESEAKDVLNSIRAAKNLSQFNPGEKAAVFGHSQGGHSTLFTANLNSSYAKDINLVGVVAAAPATELNALFATQYDKPLVWAIAPEIYVSWLDRFKLPTSVIDPGMTEKRNQEIANLCITAAGARAIFNSKLGKKYFVSNPTENKLWYEAFSAESPEPVLGTPVMVLQGLADTVVLPNATALYVKKSCAVGSNLSSFWYKDVSHAELPNVTSDDTLDWLNSRFDGEKAESNCALPLPISPAAEVFTPVN